MLVGLVIPKLWRWADGSIESQTTRVQAEHEIDFSSISDSAGSALSLANVDLLTNLERDRLQGRIVSESDIHEFLDILEYVPLTDKKAAFILEVLQKLPVPTLSEMREVLFRLPSSIREDTLFNWTIRLLKENHTVDTLKELYGRIESINLSSSEEKKSLGIILETAVALNPEAAYSWLTNRARSSDELIDLLDLDAVSNAPDNQRRAFVELCLKDLESASRKRFIADYLISLAKSEEIEAMGSMFETIRNDEALLDQCIAKLGFEIESVPNEVIKNLEGASAFAVHEFFTRFLRNGKAQPEEAKAGLLSAVAIDGTSTVQYQATSAFGRQLDGLPAETIARQLGELSENPWMQLGLIDGLLRNGKVDAEEVVAVLQDNGQTRVADLLNNKVKLIQSSN